MTSRQQVLVIFITILIAFIGIKLWSARNESKNAVQQALPSPSPVGADKNTPVSCTDEELQIDSLDKTVKDNAEAMKLIRKNCLAVIESNSFDVTGDSKPELLLNASAFDCGSCHGRNVYIFQGDKVIFQQGGDDSVLSAVKTNEGFVLTEPIRTPNEPLCCATQQKITTYKYDPSSKDGKFFLIVSEREEKVASQ